MNWDFEARVAAAWLKPMHSSDVSRSKLLRAWGRERELWRSALPFPTGRIQLTLSWDTFHILDHGMSRPTSWALTQKKTRLGVCITMCVAMR